MKYHFKVHREQNGFWAECLELKGCVTQGDTIIDLYNNIKKVLNLFLDSDRRCCSCQHLSHHYSEHNSCKYSSILIDDIFTILNDRCFCRYKKKKLDLKISKGVI